MIVSQFYELEPSFLKHFFFPFCNTDKMSNNTCSRVKFLAPKHLQFWSNNITGKAKIFHNFMSQVWTWVDRGNQKSPFLFKTPNHVQTRFLTFTSWRRVVGQAVCTWKQASQFSLLHIWEILLINSKFYFWSSESSLVVGQDKPFKPNHKPHLIQPKW